MFFHHSFLFKDPCTAMCHLCRLFSLYTALTQVTIGAWHSVSVCKRWEMRKKSV